MGGMKPIRLIRLVVGCLSIWAAMSSAFAQDKMVLGIELGARYAVPACQSGDSSRLCFDKALTNRQPSGADEYSVFIAKAATPPYMRDDLRVLVLNGMVESVVISTWGIQAQDLALAEFTKKYGAPTRARQETSRIFRSRIPTQYAEWELKAFSVKLDGALKSIDWGRVTLSTHRYRKIVEDYEKQVPVKAPSTR